MVLELDSEFQAFLPRHLQNFFLEKDPNQLTMLRAQADNGDLMVEYLGNRIFKFLIRSDNPFYEELSQF